MAKGRFVLIGLGAAALAQLASLAHAADPRTPARHGLAAAGNAASGDAGAGANQLVIDDTPGADRSAQPPRFVGGATVAVGDVDRAANAAPSGSHALYQDLVIPAGSPTADQPPPAGGPVPIPYPNAAVVAAQPTSSASGDALRFAISPSPVDRASNTPISSAAARLGSLNALGSMNDLFANSRGGDQPPRGVGAGGALARSAGVAPTSNAPPPPPPPPPPPAGPLPVLLVIANQDSRPGGSLTSGPAGVQGSSPVGAARSLTVGANQSVNVGGARPR